MVQTVASHRIGNVQWAKMCRGLDTGPSDFCGVHESLCYLCDLFWSMHVHHFRSSVKKNHSYVSWSSYNWTRSLFVMRCVAFVIKRANCPVDGMECYETFCSVMLGLLTCQLCPGWCKSKIRDVFLSKEEPQYVDSAYFAVVFSHFGWFWDSFQYSRTWF